MNLQLVLLFLELTSARFRRKLDVLQEKVCASVYFFCTLVNQRKDATECALKPYCETKCLIEIWHFMTVFIFKEKESYHLDASTD